MQARYAGKCHKCGEAIAVGMPITWNRAIRGSTSHVSCSDVWARSFEHNTDDGCLVDRDGRHTLAAKITPASASIREKIDAMDGLASTPESILDEASKLISKPMPKPCKHGIPYGSKCYYCEQETRRALIESDRAERLRKR